MKFSADLKTLSRKFVFGLEGNIRIGRERENDLITLPRRLHQLVAKQFRCVHLRDNLAIEISSRAVAKIFVRWSAEAIRAAVNTTSITIDGMVEADVGTVVVSDDRAGGRLFKDFELVLRRLTKPFN